jgi:uncharacterized membrane protein YraQ (UPF0718 family)
MKEWTKFAVLIAVFALFYFAPIDAPIVLSSLTAGLRLLQEYARLHVLTCLVPAFFIAGTIAVYVKKDAVVSLLGPTTKKYIAYPIASVSGGILAVCSCTILPLFTGIYKRGAGIGPAIAFLFTGPAINVTAILLTSSVLGWDFAIGRLLAAVLISVIAGMIMGYVFREHDEEHSKNAFATGIGSDLPYSNAAVLTFFALQLAVLVVFGLSIAPIVKAAVIVTLLIGVVGMVLLKFQKEHSLEWLTETWGLTKKILPYLFVGVFIAGLIEVVVPQEFFKHRRFIVWSSDVLCDSDRSADHSEADGLRNGEGTSVDIVSDGQRLKSSKHHCAAQSDGNKENSSICGDNRVALGVGWIVLWRIHLTSAVWPFSSYSMVRIRRTQLAYHG